MAERTVVAGNETGVGARHETGVGPREENGVAPTDGTGVAPRDENGVGTGGEGRAVVHELSAAELGAWRGLLRVHSALVKQLDAELLASHALPLTSYEVLIHLQSAPGRRCRMAELADSVLLSRSGMTRLVDRLERDGLLERDVCSSDGRGTFAVLTEKGDELLSRARATHLDGVRDLFLRHFEPAELQTLRRLWERVLPGAADLSPPD
jgi:DNA-binding MarR family transcriptional regulator